MTDGSPTTEPAADLDADAIAELVNDSHDRWDAGRRDAVLTDLRRAVPAARRLFDADPARHRGLFAAALLNLEGRLAAVGLDEELLPVLRDVIAALDGIGPDELPEQERSRHRLMRLQAMRRLARAQARLGDLDAALAAARAARAEAVAMDDDLYNHSVFSATEQRGHCDALLSELLERAGLVTESIAAIEKAVDAEVGLQVDNPDRDSLPLAERYADRGLLLLRHDRPADAQASLRAATRMYAARHADDPADDSHRRTLALCANRAGVALSLLDRDAEAVEFFQRAVAAGRAAGRPDAEDQAALAGYLRDLAVCLIQLDRHGEAVAALEEAAELWRGLRHEEAHDTERFAEVLDRLWRGQRLLGRDEQAARTRAERTAITGEEP